jgi:hypothetical protein
MSEHVMIPTHDRDRGASALIIAFAMVLLLGIAALVIDATGAGFNERRQDQTAADTAVMSGGLGFVIGEPGAERAANALAVARENLDTDYSNDEWRVSWETCVDTEIGAVDVGLPNPIAFDPMPNPLPGATTSELSCVSQSSSFMRIVIPDQFVETSFGRILGVDQLATNAEAIARVEPRGDTDGLLPFGIPGATDPGEICLSTNPSGLVQDPCQGPSAGGFGTINSEFFGDFFGTATCANPGAHELAQNIALGIDHFIDLYPALPGLNDGDPHPGDVTISGYAGVSYDQCTLSGGIKTHQQPGQAFPPNSHRVDTGFPSGAVESGLISNDSFLGGQRSRLQETPNPTQRIVKRRQGANEVLFDLDDRGPWYYLTGSGPCSPSDLAYTSGTTAEKIVQFQACLTGYSPSDGAIFDAGIELSPRFAWAPQYWHTNSTSGTSWQPVQAYRMVFLGGLWFNCSSGICGASFYPDETDETGNAEVCEVSGGGCSLLNLDQLSGWLLPNTAVPVSVSGAFPGSPPSPFEITLFR